MYMQQENVEYGNTGPWEREKWQRRAQGRVNELVHSCGGDTLVLDSRSLHADKTDFVDFVELYVPGTTTVFLFDQRRVSSRG